MNKKAEIQFYLNSDGYEEKQISIFFIQKKEQAEPNPKPFTGKQNIYPNFMCGLKPCLNYS